MKYLKNRLIVLMLMLMIPNAWTLADTGGFGFNVLDARASTLDVGEIHVYCPKQYEIG